MSNHDDTRLTCDDVRSLAFDARSSDDREAAVTGERRAGFDRHLEDCSECRAYVGQIDGMLESAAEADPADWASDGADEAFDAIMDQVDGESGGDDALADGGSSVSFQPQSYYAVAGLAAGILLTLTGFFLWGSLGPSATAPDSPTMSRSGEEGRTASAGAAPDENTSEESAPDEAGLDRELGKLAGGDSPAEGVDIYATPDASWELTGREPVTVRLDAGTILVEYLPDGAEGMRVQTRDTQIRVTGTVFYVTTDGAWTSAGVAEGRVDVEVPGRDQPIAVEAGQRLGAGYQLESLSDRARAAIDAHVDLEKHRSTLETMESSDSSGSDEAPDRESGGELAAVPSSPDRAPEDNRPDDRSTESAPSKTKPSERRATEGERPALPDRVAELRRQARAAMNRRDFAAAVRHYESMLDRLPNGHDAIPSVHLDVARIYLRNLDRPKAAARHLRTFVTRWPDDPAAKSARDEFCRIATELGRDDPLCTTPTDSDQK
ncbi:MAG: FecR domain-containing protein [Bradymonadaceae bacterium]